MRTGLYASLFTAVIVSVLVAASAGVFASGNREQINCFFDCPGTVDNTVVPANKETTAEVIPGGMPFGVKMYTGGPVAEDFAEIEDGSVKCCPAREAGIKKGDLITGVNGEPVRSAEEVVKAISSSDGDAEISIERDGEETSVKVSPIRGRDGIKRIGLLIKDCTAGIGTVTFIIPETGEFMGLGHGICDSDTGKLIPLKRGIVTDVRISGAQKGKTGDPGELKGAFENKSIGIIKKNTDSGVVGYFNSDKFDPSGSEERITVGSKSDLKEGDAFILTTVGPGEARKYSVKIENVPERDEAKNFELRITDPDLINATGGIVQGMSGSPIIQNEKLVGAVTHVMINDPVRGYGIMIGEMLREAEI